MLKLSDLIKNQFVADAFRRAERDGGAALAAPAPKGPVLVGGEVA